MSECQSECSIPLVIRGSWYSWENGRNTLTEFNADHMTERGNCINVQNVYNTNYTILFQKPAEKCYTCVKIMVRTVNVLEKIESKFLISIAYIYHLL